MALIGNLIVKLRADTSAFNRALVGTGSVVKALYNRVHLLKIALGKLGVGFAAYLTIRGVKGSIKLFTKYHNVVEDLAASLRNAGAATKDLVPELRDYASHLQDITVYSEEAILAEMAYIKNMGLLSWQLKDAAKAAIGLATKYRIDLHQAMKLVENAVKGDTRALWEYGIVIDKTLTPLERFNALQKETAHGFELAKKEAKSAMGQIEQYKNELETARREWGKQWMPKYTWLLEELAGAARVIGAIPEAGRLVKHEMQNLLGFPALAGEKKEREYPKWAKELAHRMNVGAQQEFEYLRSIAQAPAVVEKYTNALHELGEELSILTKRTDELFWKKRDWADLGLKIEQVEKLASLWGSIEKARKAKEGGGRWTDIGGVWKGAASASMSKGMGTAVLEQIGRDQQRTLEDIERNTDPDMNQDSGGGLR